jgi:hypothetical protein
VPSGIRRKILAGNYYGSASRRRGRSPRGAETEDIRLYGTRYWTRGLRDQIHLMGGGLIESAGGRHHYVWMPWIATNMSDVFDAYARHIYWWYDKPGRFEYRLRDVAALPHGRARLADHPHGAVGR